MRAVDKDLLREKKKRERERERESFFAQREMCRLRVCRAPAADRKHHLRPKGKKVSKVRVQPISYGVAIFGRNQFTGEGYIRILDHDTNTFKYDRSACIE